MTEKKRDYKRYPEEFKKDAASLALEQHDTPQQAADAVGVNVKLIYNWKGRIESKNSPGALSEEEHAELLALRKEVKNLRMEKEILKKASEISTGHCNGLTQFIKWS
jgi:transposase